MKIGTTIIEYIKKYDIQNIDLLIDSIDTIHPMWPIDEYANNGRRCVWFIPSTPPTNALIPAVVARIVLDCVLYVVIISRVRGASFCQVDRVRQLIHDSEAITEGYQKWHGAIPSLMNIATIIVHIGIDWFIGWYIILIPRSITIEPKACDKKYLIDASVSWLDFVDIISGMNLNILISSIIQAVSQLGLIIVINVLMINSEYIAHKNGVWLSIKIWRSWTPD